MTEGVDILLIIKMLTIFSSVVSSGTKLKKFMEARSGGPRPLLPIAFIVLSILNTSYVTR